MERGAFARFTGGLASRTLRSDRVAVAVVGLGTFATGFLPLFGGPGYEQSVAAGLLVPPTAAVAAALATRHLRRLTPVQALGRGAALGGALALVALLTALLHGLRVGFCDAWGGILHFALTSGAGALVGGVWGAAAALLVLRGTARRGAVVAAALAGPLGGILGSLLRFYASPIIFAFDPFVGYFSGTLYDTVVDAGPALLSYRLETLFFLAGGLLVAAGLERDESGGVRLPRPMAGAGRIFLALGAIFLGAAFTMLAREPALGHAQTAETIAAALGGRLEGPRCTVLYPRAEGPVRGDLLLRDCESQLRVVEETLGAKGPPRVTAFFFRDAAEKRHFMGAADTYIAKPWRGEVYLQMASFPHPVLGHELGHVVAGTFGRGPFRISGPFFGLWPNPGLIEGVAVASSPDEDELTALQWARAMMDADILPPLESVFGMGFLTNHAAKSYTLAGAFVTYALETRGAAAVRAWYGGASEVAALGKPWLALDEEFRAHLATVPMPEAARLYAKGRFDRKGVFSRSCPHVVEALRRAADQCREDHALGEALELYDRALAKDPSDAPALLGRAQTLFRAGQGAEARAELVRLEASPRTPSTVKDRIRELRADMTLLEGDGAQAEGLYRDLAATMLDEDVARTLEVKALGAGSEVGQRAIRALLLGTETEPTDAAVAFLRLRAWWDASEAPVAAYLLAKNLAQRLRYDEADVYLRLLRGGPAPTARIGREVLRLEAVVACVRGDFEALGAAAEAAESPDGPFVGSAGGRRAALRRAVRACRGH